METRQKEYDGHFIGIHALYIMLAIWYNRTVRVEKNTRTVLVSYRYLGRLHDSILRSLEGHDHLICQACYTMYPYLSHLSEVWVSSSGPWRNVIYYFLRDPIQDT